jgi:hypothetical protein
MNMSDILKRMNELGLKMKKGTATERNIMDFQLLFCKQSIISLNVKGTDELKELPKSELVEAIDAMAALMWQDSWEFNPRKAEEPNESLVQKEEGSKEA